MSQWVPVSYRARDQLWIPEISVINILDIKRLGLLEETGIIRVRGDKELFRYNSYQYQISKLKYRLFISQISILYDI